MRLKRKGIPSTIVYLMDYDDISSYESGRPFSCNHAVVYVDGKAYDANGRRKQYEGLCEGDVIEDGWLDEVTAIFPSIEDVKRGLRVARLWNATFREVNNNEFNRIQKYIKNLLP